MADSFSDEYLAPTNFHISTVTEDVESKSSTLTEKCLLCLNLRKVFYCQDCVRNGDFVCSTSKYPERFAEKKLQYLRLKNDLSIVHSKCYKMMERKRRKQNLEVDINLYKERIQILKKYCKETRETNVENTKSNERLLNRNQYRKIRFPKYKERVEKMQKYAEGKKAEGLDLRKLITNEYEKLKILKQKNIQDLVYYIFPISRIGIQRQDQEVEACSTVCELAEATRTSYIRGKWIYLDTNLESSLRIVAPTLPENGDYSAYNNWMESHKDGVVDDDKIENNQAYNISAALSYTAQLVNLLAFYLDVILPKRVSYSDFCNIEMNERRFNKKLMWLNMNVLYLCMSQKIDANFLQPCHTLNNILCLLKHKLGVSDPFEIDHNLVISLENKMETDDDDDDDGDDDDGSGNEENDTFSYEWEAIPCVPCPESTPGTVLPPQMNSAQTQSMASGLVTSLQSIWRGFTGK